MSSPSPQTDPESGPRSPRSCRNCGVSLDGRYCAYCGQEDRPLAQPLGQWLRDLVEQVASLDSRLVRTLRLLLLHPGEATKRYIAGQRQPQTPPLRLYVGVSAVAIALMSITGFVQLDSLVRDLSPDQIAEIERAVGVDEFRDPEFRAGPASTDASTWCSRCSIC